MTHSWCLVEYISIFERIMNKGSYKDSHLWHTEIITEKLQQWRLPEQYNSMINPQAGEQHRKFLALTFLSCLLRSEMSVWTLWAESYGLDLHSPSCAGSVVCWLLSLAVSSCFSCSESIKVQQHVLFTKVLSLYTFVFCVCFFSYCISFRRLINNSHITLQPKTGCPRKLSRVELVDGRPPVKN